MKFLLVMMILNGNLANSPFSDLDSTRFEKFISKTKVGLNFNYHHSIRRKGDIQSIDAQQQYDWMLEYGTPNTVRVGQTHTNELCYVYGGSQGILAGIFFKSPFHIKKKQLNAIYGVNFSWDKSFILTSREKRMELFEIHSNYLASQGQYFLLGSYEMDTTTVKKIYYERGITISMGINYNLTKKLMVEGGSFILIGSNDKTIKEDYDKNNTVINRGWNSGFYLNPYLSLNYALLKKMELQFGFNFNLMLFGSVRYSF